MAIFDYPFTNIENYPIVSPFELNNFLSESRPRITLHIGGQVSKKWNSEDHEGTCFKRRAAKILNPEKKVGPNVEERDKIEEKLKWKETQRKNGLKWRWRETNKEKENDPSRDEEWSLVWSPWNIIWAYLSFISKPWTMATLRTWKVHFDRM